MSTAAPTPAGWARDFVLLAAIWGSSFLFMRLAVVDFGPVATAALRVGIGAAVLLPVLVWRGQAAQLRAHWRAFLLVGLLNSGLPFVLYAFAVTSITTGLSAILNATTPMFGALMAWLWLGERLSLWRNLGLLLGFAGVTLLAWDQASFRSGLDTQALWAVLACLGACLSYGVAASYTRWRLSQVPPLVTATGSQVGAAAGLLLPALLAWPVKTPQASAWAAVLVLGVVCTGLAYLLFYRLIAKAGPSRALTVTYLIPLFAVVYGLVLLDERLTPPMLAGGAVILLGTALATGMLRPGARDAAPARKPSPGAAPARTAQAERPPPGGRGGPG